MSKVNELLTKQPILLIDGDCVLCNKSVNFLLKNEKKPMLSFASLQSNTGKMLLEYFEVPKTVDSMVLIRNHQIFIKSCAALRITTYMKGLWPLMVVFVIIPPFLRNLVYDYIAKRRFKIHGKTNACEMIESKYRSRFLEI
jgi:predicted DCC family thiol-disulfide oxidoreductase YuxK